MPPLAKESRVMSGRRTGHALDENSPSGAPAGAARQYSSWGGAAWCFVQCSDPPFARKEHCRLETMVWHPSPTTARAGRREASSSPSLLAGGSKGLPAGSSGGGRAAPPIDARSPGTDGGGRGGSRGEGGTAEPFERPPGDSSEEVATSSSGATCGPCPLRVSPFPSSAIAGKEG